MSKIPVLYNLSFLDTKPKTLDFSKLPEMIRQAGFKNLAEVHAFTKLMTEKHGRGFAASVLCHPETFSDPLPALVACMVSYLAMSYAQEFVVSKYNVWPLYLFGQKVKRITSLSDYDYERLAWDYYYALEKYMAK